MKKPAGIGYIKGLDILKFIAAIGVILHHTGLQLAREKLHFLSLFWDSGAFFLNLFFVISGYLIATILFREMDSGQFNLKNFYMRRILRIWPMYFFTVLLFVVILPLAHGAPGDEVGGNTVYASLFVVNYQLLFSTANKSIYVILWSVCIEEQIYILFPLFMRVFKGSKTTLAAAMIIVGFISWLTVNLIVGYMPNGYFPNYFFTTSYFYYFGLGCLLSIIVTKNSPVTQKINSVLISPILQALFIVAGLLFVFSPQFIREINYMYVVFSGMFTAYLVYCAANGKLIIDFLPEKVSRFLGNVSYPMYLLHIRLIAISFFLLKGVAPSAFKFQWILPVTVMLVTVAASALCNIAIERPFMKLKKKFTVIANK